MTNKPPRPITREDLERLGEPLKSSLWPLKYATARYGVDYGRTHKAAVERRRAILNADFAAIEARILAYAHYHNPAPYYSWFCSAMTRSAVHKANVAVDEYYDHSHIVTRWLALSYATDRGIVFG